MMFCYASSPNPIPNPGCRPLSGPVTTVFWCVWSFYVVDVTGSYRYALGGRQDRARIQPDCEAPDSNTIYYLYVLGWVSAVSSIYGIVITTMVGCVYTNRTVRKQSCWPDL